jgi:hypothetical protein
VPVWSDRTLTPTSTAWPSFPSTAPGASSGKIEHGHTAGPTVNVVDTAVPTLKLSSTARTCTVRLEPAAPVAKEYDQLVQPSAGCHEAPASVETSTAPTAPRTSEAVPCTVTVPAGTVDRRRGA